MARDLILVDTCVFIKAFRRDTNTLKNIKDLKGRASYSVITKLELLVGASTNSRKEAVSNILLSYYGISLSPAISVMAVSIMEKYISGQRNISIPDCLIAATSIVTGFKLFTHNQKDFDFIEGVELYRF